MATAPENDTHEPPLGSDPKKIGRSLHGAPVVAAEGLAQWRQELLVAAVGSRGARALIRERLAAMGWREGDDFFCAA